jgi:hypothetical protein
MSNKPLAACVLERQSTFSIVTAEAFFVRYYRSIFHELNKESLFLEQMFTYPLNLFFMTDSQLS